MREMTTSRRQRTPGHDPARPRVSRSGLPHRPAALATKIKPAYRTATTSARHVPGPAARPFTRTRPAHPVTLTAGNPAARTHNRRSGPRHANDRRSSQALRIGDMYNTPQFVAPVCVTLGSLCRPRTADTATQVGLLCREPRLVLG